MKGQRPWSSPESSRLTVTLDVVGDVEPRLPVPDVVVVVWTVEPSVSIGVLDTVVVEGSVVVDAHSMVVLVVASVVLVVAPVVDVVASVVLVVASVVVVVVSRSTRPSATPIPTSLADLSDHDTVHRTRRSRSGFPGIVVVAAMPCCRGTGGDRPPGTAGCR